MWFYLKNKKAKFFNRSAEFRHHSPTPPSPTNTSLNSGAAG